MHRLSSAQRQPLSVPYLFAILTIQAAALGFDAPAPIVRSHRRPALTSSVVSLALFGGFALVLAYALWMFLDLMTV